MITPFTESFLHFSPAVYHLMGRSKPTFTWRAALEFWIPVSEANDWTPDRKTVTKVPPPRYKWLLFIILSIFSFSHYPVAICHFLPLPLRYNYLIVPRYFFLFFASFLIPSPQCHISLSMSFLLYLHLHFLSFSYIILLSYSHSASLVSSYQSPSLRKSLNWVSLFIPNLHLLFPLSYCHMPLLLSHFFLPFLILMLPYPHALPPFPPFTCSTSGKCHLYISRENVYSNALIAMAFQSNSSYRAKANMMCVS